MKKQVAAAGMLIVLVSLLVRAESKEKTPLKTVSSVDLSRYAGVWYEIARLPNSFQNKCAGEVSATYSLLEKNRIKVVNQCRKNDGRITKAEGVARLADKNGPTSELKVRFAPSFLSFLPFVWGDYQIIELADDYTYSVVGEPTREYLWILSRSPQMDEDTFARLTAAAASQGFDVSKLVRTRQQL